LKIVTNATVRCVQVIHINVEVRFFTAVKGPVNVMSPLKSVYVTLVLFIMNMSWKEITTVIRIVWVQAATTYVKKGLMKIIQTIKRWFR